MAMRAVAVLLLLAVASVLAAGAAAQSTGTPACASKLTGCAGYMNGTDAQKPPETCCGPLRDAVKNEKPCLCALYASPEIFKAFNINVTDALRLSKRCGVSEDVSSCPSNPPAPPPPSPFLANFFYRISEDAIWSSRFRFRNLLGSVNCRC
ncbi:hypothetical protein VPH35_139378 [Triticum aestivum]